MPLTLLDFVQQVESVTVDDIPDSTQDSINDELSQQTSGGGGGTDISNPSDARIVAEVAGDNSGESNLNGRAGFTSIQDAIDGTNGRNGASDEGIKEDGTIFVEPGTYNESVTLSTSGVTIQSTQGSGETIINGDGVNSGSQPHAAIHVDDGSGPVQNVTIDGFTVKNPNGKFGIFAGTGTTNSSPDGIGGLVVQNNTVQDISTTSSGGSLTGGPAGIGIRGDYGTNGSPGIELSNNTVENVQSSGFTNAVGISLKSFTGDAGFGFDSSGSSVSDSSSPPATDTDINNNQILSIDGGDDSRTKGISVSGEFEDVVVDGNNISGISAADDGSAGDALAITLTENGGSYPGNEYDIDGDGNGERIGPRDFEIKNNTIDNLSAASESAVFVGGYEDLDGDGSHAVTGNTINDGTVARFAGNQPGFQPGDEDALNATGNTFTDTGTVNYYSDPSTGSDLNTVFSENTFQPDVVVGDAVIREAPSDGTVLNVDKAASFSSIQPAIDDADPGDSIFVGAGDFDENLKINKSLALGGVLGSGFTTIIGSGSNPDPGVAVEASDVSVSGLDITGTDSTVSGISIRTSKGATQDVTLGNNRINGIIGAGGGGDVQVSFGILSFGDSKLDNLRIVNNVISNVGRTSASNVAGQSEVPGFGMQLEEISGAFVFDNIVRDTRGTATNAAGDQIQNYGIGIQPLDDNSVSADFAAIATVQQNTIEDVAVGIVRGNTDKPGLTQIANNTFNSVDTEIRQIPQNTTTN